MNTCVNSRLLFVGICKRPFQKKDWRPQNTLSSHVEFISHKTTLKEILRYLDVQVYRCVLQIPLCTMKPPHNFFRIFDGQGNLYRNSLSVDVENNKQANPLELYQLRFHILVLIHCLFVGPVQLEIWGAACSARHQHPQIGSGSKTSFPNLTNLLNWGHLRFRRGDFLLIPLLTFYGLQKAWNVTDVDSLDYFGLISGLRRCLWRRFL